MHHQYSELKHLKNIFKEDKIILSVDFPKHYNNKQFNEIQTGIILVIKLSSYTSQRSLLALLIILIQFYK